MQARAKLNLFLHVVGKRADGYHELASQVVFPDLADMLTFEESDLLTLAVHGEFAGDSGVTAYNLVLRAARLLQQETETKRGARITLEKNIPVGAGLGGGSADAAATLRALNMLWALHLEPDELADIGAELGADVPMCVFSRHLYATGIGDEIEFLSLPQLFPIWAVLVYPRISLATAHVYALVTDEEVARHQFAGSAWVHRSLGQTRNDLQRAAIAASPIVGEVLLAMETQLPEPDLVRMTGSGACCFALFLSEEDAQRYAGAMQRDHPAWWVRTAKVEE